MWPSVDKICQKRRCKSEIDSESFKLSISVTSTIRDKSFGQEFRKETFGVCFRLHVFRKEVCSTIRTPNLSFPTDYAASLVAQLVKNLPAMWSPGFNPWVGKIPCPGEFHGLQSMGSRRVGCNWKTFTFTFTDYTVSLGKALHIADLCERGHISITIAHVDMLCKL